MGRDIAVVASDASRARAHLTGVAAVPRSETEARVDRTEALLLHGHADRAVARIVAQEFGVTTRSGPAWVRRVRERWRRNTGALPRTP